MTHKTRPIRLPIDPAKARLYVARNGVRVKSISKYPNICMYDDGKVYFMDEGGRVLRSSGNSYDLTHEIIPEAPERDWSKVIDKLTILANRCLAIDTYKMRSWITIDAFQDQALAILKEFDAQNQPDLIDNSVCCDSDSDKLSELEEAQSEYRGTMAEIDMIVEEMARCYKNGYSWSIKQFFEKNYPKQWEKYMNQPVCAKDAPAEEIELVVGEMYDITTGKAMIYIGKHPTSGNYLFTDPEEYGSVYDFAKDRIIGKHTPAPAVHEVEFLIDVYRNKDGAIIVLPVSIKGNGELIASGLHFKRTFADGEGL